jgi:hypothetical protein
MSLEESDRIAAEGATAPRVTLDDIKDNIAAEYTFTGRELQKSLLNAPGHASLDVLTIHIIVLRNGFTIVGKSAPADERNFDAEKGRHFAREDAMRQAWPLMGYALREKLAGR